MKSTVLPHLTAPTSAWQLRDWRLADGTPLARRSAVVEHWDYQSDTEVRSEAVLSGPTIRETCGLGIDARVTLVTVATFSVSELPVQSVAVPVDLTVPTTQVPIALSLDPGLAGGTVTLERHLVLESPGNGHAPLAARRKGAYLLSEGGAEAQRLVLEGEASRFPTELLDFRKANFPESEAMWFLEVDTSSLDDQFGSAARLYVNTAHPASEAMQSPDSPLRGAVASVLGWDVARQLIARVVSTPDFEEGLGTFDEGSLGAVVERMIEFYLPGQAVAATRRLVLDEPARFESLVQHATGVLRDL